MVAHRRIFNKLAVPGTEAQHVSVPSCPHGKAKVHVVKKDGKNHGPSNLIFKVQLGLGGCCVARGC